MTEATQKTDVLLVVEEEQALRELFARVGREMEPPMEVREADNPADGIRIITEIIRDNTKRLAAVLVDLRMGGKQHAGVEVAIAAADMGAHRVALMTGGADDVSEEAPGIPVFYRPSDTTTAKLKAFLKTGRLPNTANPQ